MSNENELHDDLKNFFVKVSQLYPVDEKAEENGMSEALDANLYSHFMGQVGSLYEVDAQLGADINVWQIAGLKRDEVRNTAVLSWWFDCQGSHCLKSMLLEQVIRDHFDEKDLENLSSKMQSPYRVKPESLPLGDLEDRIDIEISSKDLLLFWEVKIDAPEGKNQQLLRYQKLLKEKSRFLNEKSLMKLIYLTTDSQKIPINIEMSKYRIPLHLKWSDVRDSFITVYNQLLDESLTKKLLGQYCEYIKHF